MAKLWHYEKNGEFVVPDSNRLPQPVINMLANGPQYFSICDNYLRGYSGFDYTRMFGEFDGPNFPKGHARFLWLRSDNGRPWLANDFSSEANGFNASFRMGLGYCTYQNTSKKLGLEVKATVFVPLGEMFEAWLVEIKNISKTKKTVDFIPAVPIFGGNRAYTEYHRDVVRLYNKSRVTDHIEILPGLEWVEGNTDASDICYYMSAETEKGRKGSRFYSDRESFLGPRNSWFSPEAIVSNKPPKHQCLGKEAVGAIEFRKLQIAPKESAKFVVLNGISHGGAAAEGKIAKYDYAHTVKSLEELKRFWDERTSRVEIETSNPELNLLWNKWWCYQLSMRYWFGNTGHPQFDYGSDFAGWRDFWQDMMAATVIDPKSLEDRTLHTLEGIRLDGTNATRFFARTKQFGSDETNGLWCDHPYWTTQTVLMLMNFLGDPGFLLKDGIGYFKDCYCHRGEQKDENWPRGRMEKQKTAGGGVYNGTVIEHLLTQLFTMFYDVGKNNLLKQKRADWNDAVDQVAGGENVTFSLGLAHDCADLAAALEELGNKTPAKEIEVFEELAALMEEWDLNDPENPPVAYKQQKLNKFLDLVDRPISGRKTAVPLRKLINELRAKAAAVIKTVNNTAWNGEYYCGYFYDNGTPVDTVFRAGSTGKNNPTPDDFMMMLMPQTWSLVSGAADRIGASEKVISSVKKLLADKKAGGLKLNYPAYWKFNKAIGRITGFAAGTKENNAIFCHANLFMAWALLKRRRADEAYTIFNGINPLNRPQETLRTGPWIPEYYISSDNPNWPGRGEYPLLTASAGWTRYLMQNFFFGVRGELDGLRIDPCLPAEPEFKDCKFSIKFREAAYEIRYSNPKLAKNSAALSIKVDGKEIEGNIIKPFNDGKTHIVEVLLGKKKI
jgi:cellobiose phosphorylase